MVPSLTGDSYAKDLSKLPSFPGGSFISNIHYFLLPDDVVMLRLTEITYDKADYDHIATVEELTFSSPGFITEHIDELREENGLSDEEVVERILALDMIDEDSTMIIARFAYNNFIFKNRDGNQVQGKQIKGAYVHPQKAGVGLAGQIYRQLAILHRHLVCDNLQTVYGAALWAVTVRNVAGRVDIYNAAREQYVEELGDGAVGVNGCIPWDIGTLTPFKSGKWQQYPYHATIHHCYYLVLIISA
ncbi:hypothetical protein [Brenneria tiliae]|uniref:hypothetical protein n=1 Tax=Brenneria tiliae TaxID=2914984 RepID=UPI002014EB8A|nr:hypothetical protein [Brenneria tiliae]MCL2899391.1 hypothetical protein [Brenneria tiliae]MCL2903769.1 hypothetical protein [Brenneria tiliae]